MRIICPHAGAPYPQTLLSLAACGYEVEYVDTSWYVTAYANLIMHLWKRQEGFVIVEQDVAFQPLQMRALVECERDYCAGVYPWTTNIGPALGFTKFGEDLLREVLTPNLAGVHYKQVDVMLMRRILGQVYERQPHLHLPPVKHLNPAQRLRPEFQHLTLAEHLGALGYEIADDGLTAEYVRATAEFGRIAA